MGTNTDKTVLQQLSPNVIEWKYYNNSQLISAQIVDQISCVPLTTTTNTINTLSTTSSPTIISSFPSSSETVLTTTSSAQMWFNQCQRNIVILVDSSSGLTSDQFNQQKLFISHTLAASGWNHFETIAFASYSGVNEFNSFSLGSFHSLEEFQQSMNSDQMSFIGSRANITRYLIYKE